MKKKILLFVLLFIIMFSSIAFAYRWVEHGGNWSVLDENTNEYVTNRLLDTGNSVYYLDRNGNMMTGWYYNTSADKFYFFSNNPNQNYGGMVFGLTIIDGYYRYFEDNGTLATSNKQGEYLKVYGEYYADYYGNLYFANNLLRDTSVAKSNYYTNALYYTNEALNNYFMAKSNQAQKLEDVKNNAINNQEDNSNVSETQRKKDSTGGHLALGGTDYYIDDYGKIHMGDDTFETQGFEKFGPMRNPN